MFSSIPNSASPVSGEPVRERWILLTKAGVIKNWKLDLQTLGFAHQKGAFYLEHTKREPLQGLISIQRNLYSDTYKINPTIVLRSPFEPAAIPRVLFLANLRRAGVFLHVATASWWPVNKLSEALEALKKHVPEWFQAWCRPQPLVEVFEKAINEQKDVIDICEPLPDEAKRPPWQQARQNRGIPPYYENCAILHYLNGDLRNSIARAQEWIASLDPGQEALRSSAVHLVSMLKQKM